MNTVDVLRGAKEILSDPERWCQGTYGDGSGMCLLQALRTIGGQRHNRHETSAVLSAQRAISVAIGLDRDGWYRLGRWNDEATHEELIDAFDRATGPERVEDPLPRLRHAWFPLDPATNRLDRRPRSGAGAWPLLSLVPDVPSPGDADRLLRLRQGRAAVSDRAAHPRGVRRVRGDAQGQARRSSVNPDQSEPRPVLPAVRSDSLAYDRVVERALSAAMYRYSHGLPYGAPVPVEAELRFDQLA